MALVVQGEVDLLKFDMEISCQNLSTKSNLTFM